MLPARQRTPSPRSPPTARTRLRFYPPTSKGLASPLVGQHQRRLRFIGGRCNDTKIPRATRSAAWAPRCFDTNPGTWHLAIVSQIGVALAVLRPRRDL
ncbi:MAG: hypothetical protein IPK80_01050 [Nannocystis sp.]|nr:hypothetical protein [Nannocystis sp.]